MIKLVALGKRSGHSLGDGMVTVNDAHGVSMIRGVSSRLAPSASHQLVEFLPTREGADRKVVGNEALAVSHKVEHRLARAIVPPGARILPVTVVEQQNVIRRKGFERVSADFFVDVNVELPRALQDFAQKRSCSAPVVIRNARQNQDLDLGWRLGGQGSETCKEQKKCH